jgi:DNA-binding response OmpR family regulator
MEEATKTKILVIDDDVKLLRDVKTFLDKQGYEVQTAENGATALALAETMVPDFVVLDITFPDEAGTRKRSIDGIEILRRLRESDNVPILMLSSTSISAVKVMALTIGADDYLPKPFDMQELGARIEAILRRTRGEDTGLSVLNLHRLKMDPGERRVWKDGTPIELTSVEFDMLYILARRPNHVFTRERLLELAWKDPSYSIPKVVDVHIGHIRKKLEDDISNPTFIVTVRGTGYRFEDAPA